MKGLVGDMVSRDVRIGCTFVQVAQVDTPAIFQVEPLPDQIAEVSEETWDLEPELRSRSYADLYGNRCRRMTIPSGPVGDQLPGHRLGSGRHGRRLTLPLPSCRRVTCPTRC